MDANVILKAIKSMSPADVEKTCIIIAVATPIIYFIGDKVAEITHDVMENGYKLRIKTKHMECELKKEAA